VPSRAARAAFQLKASGKELRPGQRVRFFHTRGEERVWAWDKPAQLNATILDTPYYIELMLRAVCTALHPLDIDETTLRSWLLYDVWQKPLPFPAESIKSNV
jgi:DNA polymerase elongation subunit (family B)